MGMSVWNNANRINKIRHRFGSYFPIAFKAMKKGVSVKGLVTSQFPFYLALPKRPLTISIELTNACDLGCLYCNNHLFEYPRTFMSKEVFAQLIRHLHEYKKVDRIRVSGGEPTLHPNFKSISENLSMTTKFLSVITNAQWKKEGICEILLKNYDLIEISVDAGGKETYENSRKGAKYELLIKNLSKLQDLKQKIKSTAHINLRLMIRPSTDRDKEKEYLLWKTYCNTIMTQYVIKDIESNYDQDIYLAKHSSDSGFPKCTLPFKDLQIRVNGDVPLCQVTGSATDKTRKRIIGNVKDDSIIKLWNCDQLNNIRIAHKKRIKAEMEVCRGCGGV